MSGSAAGGGYLGGQLVFGRLSGDQPAAGFGSSFDDTGGIFVSSQSSAPGAGGDGGGLTTQPAYDCSSVTEYYLQGFLEHNYPLDAGDAAADAVKQPGSSAAEEEDEGDVDEAAASADHQKCRGNGLKKKQKKKEEEEKKGARRARGSRLAFATKSEVDHLDDGYRWRKYGQKAVKNSSYPRSYYRCTAARCGVKKQVERSQQDPATVITTYEGQHQHPSPITCRLPPPLVGAGATMLAAYHSSLIAAAAHSQGQLLHHDIYTPSDVPAAPPLALLPQAAAEYYDGPQALLPGFVVDNRRHGQT